MMRVEQQVLQRNQFKHDAHINIDSLQINMLNDGLNYIHRHFYHILQHMAIFSKIHCM